MISPLLHSSLPATKQILSCAVVPSAHRGEPGNVSSILRTYKPSIANLSLIRTAVVFTS